VAARPAAGGRRKKKEEVFGAFLAWNNVCAWHRHVMFAFAQFVRGTTYIHVYTHGRSCFLKKERKELIFLNPFVRRLSQLLLA
jgi:hypothetical protein